MPVSGPLVPGISQTPPRAGLPGMVVLVQPVDSTITCFQTSAALADGEPMGGLGLDVCDAQALASLAFLS